MAASLPPRDELSAALQRTLQESDVHRELDSIEVMSVRAYLARWDLEHPADEPFPTTIAEWIEWAALSSQDS